MPTKQQLIDAGWKSPEEIEQKYIPKATLQEALEDEPENSVSSFAAESIEPRIRNNLRGELRKKLLDGN